MADFPYLRRRRPPVQAQPSAPAGLDVERPGAAAPASGLSLSAAPAPARPDAPASSGLSLSSAAPAPSPAARTPVAPTPQAAAPGPAARRPPLRTPTPGARARLFPAPLPGRLTELDADNPVVRLDALRSSIGSLLVDGAIDAVWESASGVTGAQSPTGASVGTVVETSGNRPLVGYEGRLAVVTLRHVRELRRALFVSEIGEGLGIRLFDGSVIGVESGGPGRTAVLLLVIDGLVELRVVVPTGTSSSDVHTEFDFEITQRFDFSRGSG